MRKVLDMPDLDNSTPEGLEYVDNYIHQQQYIGNVDYSEPAEVDCLLFAILSYYSVKSQDPNAALSNILTILKEAIDDRDNQVEKAFWFAESFGLLDSVKTTSNNRKRILISDPKKISITDKGRDYLTEDPEMIKIKGYLNENTNCLTEFLNNL